MTGLFKHIQQQSLTGTEGDRFGHNFTKETAVQNQGGVKIEKEVRSFYARAGYGSHLLTRILLKHHEFSPILFFNHKYISRITVCVEKL